MERLCLMFITLATVNGHVAYWNTPNKLQPVHGLYVKPSVDGTTGDLYVAATEENGVKSQWLTDQPVNFLPVAANHQPIAFTPNIVNTEESVNTQKRAVVNPPMQYAYAYPVPGHTEGNSILPYPYAIPTTNPSSNPTETSNTRDTPVATLPHYNPFHYFYPQMIAAYADLINNLKESGTNEESGSTTVQTPPTWPQTYAYPVQYVMMDPSMWSQTQTSSTAPASTAVPASVTNIENE